MVVIIDCELEILHNLYRYTAYVCLYNSMYVSILVHGVDNHSESPIPPVTLDIVLIWNSTGGL